MKRKTIEARKAVRSVTGLLAVAWIGLAAAGCGIEDTNGSKIEDVEFTVLEEEAVPEELKQEIEERKENSILQGVMERRKREATAFP